MDGHPISASNTLQTTPDVKILEAIYSVLVTPLYTFFRYLLQKNSTTNLHTTSPEEESDDIRQRRGGRGSGGGGRGRGRGRAEGAAPRAGESEQPGAAEPRAAAACEWQLSIVEVPFEHLRCQATIINCQTKTTWTKASPDDSAKVCPRQRHGGSTAD